ncbi:negative regulator of genetic competence, sporulation and motility [Desulfitobacterium dichloroeliminans LMG P-21439]|uniref:Negative regulator of genetic competence, sporulation and motility n=1 Tax=Desulfitobacterium dichloroeliminans (strain LMG P-21439 / DCA1) TaxID=871963 RepID=L0FC69_DESDL|nr:adaptor protein MecA [Desulfitobacterium dichloroeliminans]AGA70251.1 negative regulator of genetic competence, sporulation and motility [Desulfitobacterium dichloroeliminans LMG P-21439]
MRIQKVNDNTIRIFISFTELADREITMADLLQRSQRSEQLFWELISQAREEVEFNLDQPFWIQATASSNEEFVITVIKQEDVIEAIPKEKENKRPSRSKATEWVYVFADLEDVLSVVRRMPDISRVRSSLFEFDGEYYLVVSHLGSGKKKQIAEALLDEYGELVDVAKIFLEEHGKVILKERALQNLKSHFKF